MSKQYETALRARTYYIRVRFSLSLLWLRRRANSQQQPRGRSLGSCTHRVPWDFLIWLPPEPLFRSCAAIRTLFEVITSPLLAANNLARGSLLKCARLCSQDFVALDNLKIFRRWEKINWLVPIAFKVDIKRSKCRNWKSSNPKPSWNIIKIIFCCFLIRWYIVSSSFFSSEEVGS